MTRAGIVEFNSSGGWSRGEVYGGGWHLATYADSTTYFDFADYPGTGRAVMTLGNTLYRTCSSDPWGSSVDCTGSSPTDPTPNFLTDKPRDPETGFDDFGARYNASSFGRWVTPDWSAKVEPVPYAKLDNPQSLNLYSYVLNNPATKVDADGHSDSGTFSARCGGDANGCYQRQAASDAKQVNDAIATARAFLAKHPLVLAAVQVGIAIVSHGEAGEGGDEFAPQGGDAPGEKATITRYMGKGEADAARNTGEIPNTDREGRPRPTHVTTDAPTNSASEAQSRYELPVAPSHRATVPASRISDLGPAPDGRPFTSGGESGAATNQPIPVLPDEIEPLGP